MNHPLGIVCIALCGITGMVIVWLWLRVLRPMRQLVQAIDATSTGTLDALAQPMGGSRDVRRLQRSLAAMAGHVRRAQQEQTSYANALQQGQEIERARLARDLHDVTLQALIVLGMSLDIAMQKHRYGDADLADYLAGIRAMTASEAQQLRDLIGDLRPPELDDLGLVAAITSISGRMHTPTTIHVEGKAQRLVAPRELAIFRCIQEALNNVERHAHASRATVTLAYHQNALQVTVSDDGEVLAWHIQPSSYGIMGMRERLLLFGGQLVFTQAEGSQGIEMSLPYHDTPTDVERDPVCGTPVQPASAYGSAEHNGKVYHFCCPMCMGAFQQNPTLYITDSPAYQPF